jgi:hypothetical protein
MSHAHGLRCRGYDNKSCGSILELDTTEESCDKEFSGNQGDVQFVVRLLAQPAKIETGNVVVFEGACTYVAFEGELEESYGVIEQRCKGQPKVLYGFLGNFSPLHLRIDSSMLSRDKFCGFSIVLSPFDQLDLLDEAPEFELLSTSYRMDYTRSELHWRILVSEPVCGGYTPCPLLLSLFLLSSEVCVQWWRGGGGSVDLILRGEGTGKAAALPYIILLHMHFTTRTQLFEVILRELVPMMMPSAMVLCETKFNADGIGEIRGDLMIATVLIYSALPNAIEPGQTWREVAGTLNLILILTTYLVTGEDDVLIWIPGLLSGAVTLMGTALIFYTVYVRRKESKRHRELAVIPKDPREQDIIIHHAHLGSTAVERLKAKQKLMQETLRLAGRRKSFMGDGVVLRRTESNC